MTSSEASKEHIMKTSVGSSTADIPTDLEPVS